MGKPKSKVTAVVVARKRKRREESSKPSNNPFEVRVNRKKHDVLGQRIKSGRGLPGVARSRAVQKASINSCTSLYMYLHKPLSRGRRHYYLSTGLATRLGSLLTSDLENTMRTLH